MKNLIGKDLVTDEVIAVFELVKNVYDVDVEEVKTELYNIKENIKLISTDNGTGMNLNDIETKWMIIRTESKNILIFHQSFIDH